MPVSRVKLARTEHGLSQQELADKVGVARQTIGLIESGNYNPTLALCLGISKVLGKTLDQLFYGEEKDDK
jgi:putative transcriptional regulator